MLRATSAFVFALAGCRVFDESLLANDVPDAMVDAAPDAVSDADMPACPLRLPPARPAVDDAPGGEDLFFAIRDIDLDQADQWPMGGYDLDELCTTQSDTPNVECLPPSRAGTPEIDGEGGVDNSFAHQVIPLVLLAYPELQPETQTTQTRGINALLMQLRGWNGEDDDPRVDVILSQSVYGVRSNEAGDGPAAVAGPEGVPFGEDNYPSLPAPRWDGDDYFFAREDLFLDGDMDRPRIRDDNAFIADRTLVVKLPDRFPISFTGVTIGTVFRLTDAVFTARFDAGFDRVELAIIAGRWSILDILDTAPTASICPGTDDYTQFARVLDLTADIRSMPNTGGPGVLCDAVSVGIRFTDGVRAHLAGLYPPYPTPRPCDMP